MSVHLPASRVASSVYTLPAERSLSAWERCLFLAIDRCDVDAIELALDRGASINVFSHFEELQAPSTDQNQVVTFVRGGMTPLHQACLCEGERAQDPETVFRMIRLLLDRGADPTLVVHRVEGIDSPPLTALDAAAMNEEPFAPDLCALLCDHGAQPTGLTVNLALTGPHFEAMLDLFFQVTPPERQADLWDQHPMDHLASQPLDEATQSLQLARMAQLVKHGGSLTTRTKGQKLTPAQALMQAHPLLGAQIVKQLMPAEATAPESTDGKANARASSRVARDC